MGTRYTKSQRRRKLYRLAWLMQKQTNFLVPILKQLIDCFDVAMTDDEIDFLLKMGTRVRNYDELRAFSDLSNGEFKTFFETMLTKGFIKSLQEQGKTETFELHPYVVGWFEMYLASGKETEDRKEFARRFDDYINAFKKFTIFPLRNIQNLNRRLSRTNFSIAPIPTDRKSETAKKIDIGAAVPVPMTEIHTAGSVNDLIEQYGSKGEIAVVHCFCRQWRKMMDSPCRFEHSAESCLGLGSLANYGIKYGIGRRVSKAEAMDIVCETEEHGAMHAVFHERDDAKLPEVAICNCCWDCCGIIGGYNRGLTPLAFKTYCYSVITDGNRCKACGACLKYCPVNVISIKNDVAVINKDKCIGCGQCVYRCPQNVPRMITQEREVILPMLRSSEIRASLRTSG